MLNRRISRFLSPGAFPAELRKDIAEMSDYQLVEEGVWRLLLAWYGGGPAFIRRVIEVGLRVSVEAGTVRSMDEVAH